MNVEISGWQKGCNSVAAIKEIRERASIPLSEALALVNRVLAKEKVAVCIPTQTGALELVEELGKVGMIAEVVIDDSFPAPATAAQHT